ncbi:CKLF-like MARVEL transmembrane domain-containing protein 7 isoform X4 [Hylobates moloch]|uniref:CKLF-like MARVEL transmembrane domain-containing protein 7 isoform X4 n=1 Tax=Hylobates moloch TaxID=81572 RepID=UPI002674413F|nr:CKLF-like MARVEL transmembrane domain-containing protein 7 isoform X4 [Hylobates moloch]
MTQGIRFPLAPVQLPRIYEGRDCRYLSGRRRPASPRLDPARGGSASPAADPGAPPSPAPAPARPRPALRIWSLGSCPGRRPASWGRAMSHGAGLVRTTCSSGSALGPGAAAAQPSASPLEGLLDPSYPRTHAALLKVAQMVTLLIAFICVRSSLWTDYSAYSYFEVVTICDLIMILAFYLVHLFRFYRVLTCISWPLSIFGFMATFLCMASIWLSYKISCVTQSTDAAV